MTLAEWTNLIAGIVAIVVFLVFAFAIKLYGIGSGARWYARRRSEDRNKR